MTHDVMVPDGPDWTITMYHCDKWLKTTWPGISHSSLFNAEVWDYRVDFQPGFILYGFKDPKKATLFKLAWGQR